MNNTLFAMTPNIWVKVHK